MMYEPMLDAIVEQMATPEFALAMYYQSCFSVRSCPMANEADGGSRLAEDDEAPEFWDVIVILESPHRGIIAVAEEIENLTEAAAAQAVQRLLRKYPNSVEDSG